MKKLGLFFKLIAVGTITLFISACYGIMYYWKSITTRDVDGNAIPGIQVTLQNDTDAIKTVSTDVNGIAELDYRSYSTRGIKADIQDVDGALNGGEFAQTTVRLDFDEEATVVLARIE